MTCRNYIPGPNGDCQRCGEMRAGHAEKINCPAGCGATDATMKIHCGRCGAVRAGHAGSLKSASLEELERANEMSAAPRKLREQIGYLIGMLQLRGDPRSLPEILDEVERATEDK